MKNIQLVHEGEDYITISYEKNGKVHETEITGSVAIEAIKTLGKALWKSTFIRK